MDVHALGSSLGDRKEIYSGSYKLLYPTRGQGLPCRGRDIVKLVSFPSSCTQTSWLWVKIFISRQPSHHSFLPGQFFVVPQLEEEGEEKEGPVKINLHKYLNNSFHPVTRVLS